MCHYFSVGGKEGWRMNTNRPYFAEATVTMKWTMRIFVTANFLVIAFCAGYLVLKFGLSRITWPYIAANLLLGYFLADFASGLVHWSMDTWFDERTLGRAIAIAREHHTHPQNIIGYGFLEHAALGSAPSAVFIGLASIVTALLFPVSIATYSLMMIWFVISMCLLFGTSFHNLCHKRTKSVLIRLLQKMYLVVPPGHHWVHHGDQTVRYCVINGWANYVCDLFQVWRGLERLVSALTGAEPRRDDLIWQHQYKKTGTLPSSLMDLPS
jgi:hypothetical protein